MTFSPARASTAGTTDPPDVVPVRRPVSWVMAALVVLALTLIVRSMATNPRFQWEVVGEYFTAQAVLHGLRMTLWLTAVTVVLGFAAGIVLAVLRLSPNPVLSAAAWGYIWLFRSIPLLVQLLFWFNIGALYPTLTIGVPFGPALFTVDTVNLIGGTAAAVIGLVLHEAAYAAEVVRAGILSVGQGQWDAARSLGMTKLRTLRRIVLPQALRTIIPPAGNMMIGTLKGTSIVSVIAIHDLLYSVQLIYNRNYLVIPLLLAATIWYVIITSILMVVQQRVERHFDRGTRRSARANPLRALPRIPTRLRRSTS